MKKKKIGNHHIWCNYRQGLRKDCQFCKRYDRLYPEKGTANDMQKKYFPKAIIRR